MAITAGATFVARGFTGDPQGLADLIEQGIRWRGFAFLEVLSPCVTFRPEQRDWKTKVRHDAAMAQSDRGAAIGRALHEDGFSLGVLFHDNELVMEPNAAITGALNDIEKCFAIGAKLEV
jgi:2-oxoglutarate ferredoxin oxidoreductase subunit beta